MRETKTFHFEHPTHISVSGTDDIGNGKKVSVRSVVQLEVTKRENSTGFSWTEDGGSGSSIVLSDLEVNVAPPEVLDWIGDDRP